MRTDICSYNLMTSLFFRNVLPPLLHCPIDGALTYSVFVAAGEHQQHFSKERETELENIDQATNQLPEEDSDDDVIILSSQQPQQTPIPPDQSSDQAQLSVTGPKPAGSTSASVQSLVPTLVQPVHSVLKKSRGAAPVIHRGGVRERQKTVPNILSRKRKPSPSPLKDTLDCKSF